MRIIPIVLGVFFLVACDLPRDPEGTLDRITAGDISIGRIAGSKPDPTEEKVLQSLLSSLQATPHYETGDAEHLVARLETGKIDLMLGGLPEDTVFAERIGLTKPVGQAEIGGEPKRTVFAVRSGENGFLKAVNERIAAVAP